MTLINTIKVLGIHNLEVKLADIAQEGSPIKKVSYLQVFPLLEVLLEVLDLVDLLELMLSLQAHRDMEYPLKVMVLMEGMGLHRVVHNQVLVLLLAVTDLRQVDSVDQLLDQLVLTHQGLVPIFRQPQLGA